MKILVFTTVYPNKKQSNLGIFVRERITRVADHCEIKVLAPIPYFPLAGLLKKKYRYCNCIPPIENQNGIDVYHPKFFIVPGIMKFLDGFFLYFFAKRTAKKIQKTFDFQLIDSHFAYPDGFAAILLGRYFKKPVTITLRGTINRLINYKVRKQLIKFALQKADKIFSVSSYLVKLAKTLGIDDNKFVVIPNGVDVSKLQLLNKFECREKLGISSTKKVIISVGALVERKGHHRVIEALPALKKEYPDIIYLVVGGSSVEGDMGGSLKAQVKQLGLEENVCFTGEVPHDSVNRLLCASDVFVLATRYEGWANVFCEAMACGLPIVTTDIGGNSEVVKEGKTGLIVPFGNCNALTNALSKALTKEWDREAIIEYARNRTWEKVAEEVYYQFNQILS